MYAVASYFLILRIIIVKNSRRIALSRDNIYYHFSMPAGTEKINCCH